MESLELKNVKCSTTERVYSAICLVGMAAGAMIVSYFNPVSAGFFPQCPFHAVTGLNCPGCGMTRGFNSLFHGDILSALHFNALLPIFVLFFGYFGLSLFLTVIRGRGLTWKIFTPNFLYFFLVLTIIFGIVRNLPIYPFNLLAI